jgi:hypothetical protein
MSRPIASTVFAVLALLLIVDVLGRLELDYGPLNVAGYLTMVDWGVATVIVSLIPRWTQQSPEQLLLLRWAIAETPFLMAFVSVMSGGPQWLIGQSFLLTTLLLIFSMKSAKNSEQRKAAGP